MHRRHAVPRKKGWAFGEEDRETLLLPPMCSAVPVRDVMCVKPTRPSPRMPAAPGAGKGQDDAWWAHSAGEWGHGNMSTAVGSNPGPEFCHLNHLASASAASASFAFAGPRQSVDPCPLFVPCPLVSDMFGGFCPRGDLEHGAELSLSLSS